MQYAILTFFICAAPWIVVIMAAVGAFEIRIRTYNLAYASRPPQPRKAANIGPWRECLRFLALMAEYVPGAHAVQTLPDVCASPASEYLPPGQSVHTSAVV